MLTATAGFVRNVYIGVWRPLSSNHYFSVLMVYIVLANDNRRLLDEGDRKPSYNYVSTAENRSTG